MRVYAPERLLASADLYSGGLGEMFLPLGGEWVDVPDYFHQVTSGRPVNDLLHAKFVDGYGLTNLYLPTAAAWNVWGEYDSSRKTINSYPRDFKQVRRVSNCFYMSIPAYETVTRMVRLEPSPKYKGKNRKERYVERTMRDLHSVCASYSFVGYAPNWDGEYYGWDTLSLTVYCLPEVVKYGTSQFGRTNNKWTYGISARVQKANVSIKVRTDGSKYYYTYEGSTGSLMDFYGLNDLIKSIGFLDGHNSHKDQNRELIMKAIYSWLKSYAAQLVEFLRLKGSTANWRVFEHPQLEFPPDMGLQGTFLFQEPYLVGERLDPILAGVSGSLANHWIQVATQHALLEACDSLPRLSDNSIQNLIEIVGFVKALVVDHKIEIPKSLADLWLSYRYQYSTTKMDASDAIKFVRRHMDLGTLDRMIVGRGVYRFDYQGTTVTCRASVEVTPKHLSKVKEIWRALDQYGLTPDFYVIWDSIPYSFMVDWFLPIGDLTSVWDANAMYFSGEFYDLANVCYSLSYTREVNGYSVNYYTRWAGSVPSSLNSFYWFEPPSASSKTWGKRVLDAGSIFIGGGDFDLSLGRK